MSEARKSVAAVCLWALAISAVPGVVPAAQAQSKPPAEDQGGPHTVDRFPSLVPLNDEEEEQVRAKARGLPLISTKTRPDCVQVISEVNRNVRTRGGQPAGAVAVAKRLGTEVAWVEMCMASSGRQTAEQSGVSRADRELLQNARESGDEIPPVDTDAVDADIPPRHSKGSRESVLKRARPARSGFYDIDK